MSKPSDTMSKNIAPRIFFQKNKTRKWQENQYLNLDFADKTSWTTICVANHKFGLGWAIIAARLAGVLCWFILCAGDGDIWYAILFIYYDF